MACDIVYEQIAQHLILRQATPLISSVLGVGCMDEHTHQIIIRCRDANFRFLFVYHLFHVLSEFSKCSIDFLNCALWQIRRRFLRFDQIRDKDIADDDPQCIFVRQLVITTEFRHTSFKRVRLSKAGSCKNMKRQCHCISSSFHDSLGTFWNPRPNHAICLDNGFSPDKTAVSFIEGRRCESTMSLPGFSI